MDRSRHKAIVFLSTGVIDVGCYSLSNDLVSLTVWNPCDLLCDRHTELLSYCHLLSLFLIIATDLLDQVCDYNVH